MQGSIVVLYTGTVFRRNALLGWDGAVADLGTEMVPPFGKLAVSMLAFVSYIAYRCSG